MVRAMRARRMNRILMYYATLTAFFIGAASLTSYLVHKGHKGFHSISVPESVAGKGIDEIVEEEEAELTQDNEKFAKPLYKDAPENQNTEI